MIYLLVIALPAQAYDADMSAPTTVSPPTADAQPSTLNSDFYPGDIARPPSVVRLDERWCAGAPLVCMSPTWRYDLDSTDATASAVAPRGFGAGLNLAGAGTAFATNAGSPLLGADADDGSVLFKAGKSYQAAAATSGDLTTDDLVLRGLLQFSGVNGQVALEKRSGAGQTLDVSGGKLRWTLSDGTHVASVSTAALTAGDWYFLECYGDKSGFGQCNVNGTSSGAPVDLSAVGSIANAGKLTIGADSSLANGYGSRIAFVAEWALASWIPNASEPSTGTQFAKLTATGAWSRAGVVASVSQHPRGYLRKYDGSSSTTLYPMGLGWPRVENVPANTYYLSERLPENLLLQSEALGTTWTKLVAGDTISADVGSVSWPAMTASGFSTTGDGLIASASNTRHGFTQAVTQGGSLPYGQDDTFSVYFKAGTFSTVMLKDDTLPYSVCFDLAACAACAPADGATQCDAAIGAEAGGSSPHANGAWAYARNYGGGICRVELQPGAGGAATHTFRWEIGCNANTTGDGASVAVYAWGADLCHQCDYAYSYVPTTTATISNLSDKMVWSGSGLIDASVDSLACTIYREAAKDSSTDQEGEFMLTNDVLIPGGGGGSVGNNSIVLQNEEHPNPDAVALEVTTAGVLVAQPDDGGSTTVGGKGRYAHAGTAKLNEYKAFSDGAQVGSTDTSGAFPTGMGYVVIGDDTGPSQAGHAFAGGISRCRVFNVGRIQ